MIRRDLIKAGLAWVAAEPPLGAGGAPSSVRRNDKGSPLMRSTRACSLGVAAWLLLLAWGILAVSTVDNLIRSWFIVGTTQVPFLLVFLGVLGGLATFGAIGLFVGPVTITLLLVLWHGWTEPVPREVDAP